MNYRLPLPLRGRRLAQGGVLSLALILAGCGLSEYETRMIATQERLRRFDEENKLLADPISMPLPKEGEPYIAVFLRPPKGIGRSPTDEGGIFHDYLPLTGKSASGFKKVEVAIGFNQKDFREQVVNKFQTGGQVTEFAPGQSRPTGHDTPSQFSTIEFDEGDTSYSINILQSGTTQVAVVYWIVKGLRTQVSNALKLSLDTLAVGPDAKKQNDAYDENTKHWKLPTP